jgi:hypothetical protein
MALVNEMSPVTALPELDLFASATVQTSIESTRSYEVRPVSQLNTGGHYEFIIHNAANEYVRPDDITLSATMRVNLLKRGSTPTIDDWKLLSLSNNFLNSLWSQVDLIIGDVQITQSLQTYPYKSYIDLILGAKKDSIRSFLHLSGFYKDDLSTYPNALNETRQNHIKPKSTATDLTKGEVFQMEGKLHLDFHFQPKAILGATTIKIKLVPNKPDFYFMTTAADLSPTIEFLDLHLNVVKSKVSNDIVSAHSAALQVSPARYPIRRCEVRTATIDAGVTSKFLENSLNGQMPRRIFFALSTNGAYTGSLSKNPYYFYHNHLKSIACYINGEQYPYARAYTPNFFNGQVLREYLSLIKVANQFNNDVRTCIEYDDFKKGYTFYGFDLSQDNSDGYYSSGYVNMPRDGVLRFALEFATATTETLNAIIYCEFDNQINILENRSAVTDYH